MSKYLFMAIQNNIHVNFAGTPSQYSFICVTDGTTGYRYSQGCYGGNNGGFEFPCVNGHSYTLTTSVNIKAHTEYFN